MRRAADALRMLAIAIVPAGAVGLLARTYYAVGDFRTPVRISCFVLLANVLLNTLFVVGLGMDVDGLALATALSSTLHLVLLLPGLVRRLGLPRTEGGFLRALARMLLAAAPCGAGAALAHAGLEPVLGRAPALFLAMATGMGIFALLSELLGIPEWTSARARVARLLRRDRPSSR